MISLVKVMFDFTISRSFLSFVVLALSAPDDRTGPVEVEEVGFAYTYYLRSTAYLLS
jgi:hypothetical protein